MTDLSLLKESRPPCTRPNPRRVAGRRAGVVLSLGVLAAAGSALVHPSATTAVPLAAGAAEAEQAPIAQSDGALTVERTIAADRAARSAERRDLADEDAAAKAAKEKAAAAKEKAASEKAAKEKADAEKAAAEKAAKAAASLDVVGSRYTTAPVNLRTAADGNADVVTTLDVGDKVSITETNVGNWQQVKFDGKARWVSEDFLAKSEPEAATGNSSSGGFSSAPCASGSGVEGPLHANAIKVHRAVCARWPQITEYGGYRSGSQYHGSGRALDIMVSDSALREEIAHWVRANADQLGVMEVIYSQRIWTQQRSGEGWRGMSDRGSTTANHYDHVHVTLY